MNELYKVGSNIVSRSETSVSIENINIYQRFL